jgi:hypothetical protein
MATLLSACGGAAVDAAEPAPRADEPAPGVASGSNSPHHHLAFDGARIEGAAPFEDPMLDRQIRTRLRAMDACASDRLGGDTRAGEMHVELTIGPDGRVTDVSVTRDDLRARAIAEECIAATLRRFRFNPGPAAPVRFRYVFRVLTP